MFRNYFAAALPNLMRNKLVSVINIGGLAAGFAEALLIGLYLRYQLRYEEFSKPLMWASLVAWPLAALLMSRWLTSVVYRVDPGWWLLPTVSLLALVITLATVSAHCYGVARAKPATSLRHE